MHYEGCTGGSSRQTTRMIEVQRARSRMVTAIATSDKPSAARPAELARSGHAAMVVRPSRRGRPNNGMVKLGARRRLREEAYLAGKNRPFNRIRGSNGKRRANSHAVDEQHAATYFRWPSYPYHRARVVDSRGSTCRLAFGVAVVDLGIRSVSTQWRIPHEAWRRRPGAGRPAHSPGDHGTLCMAQKPDVSRPPDLPGGARRHLRVVVRRGLVFVSHLVVRPPRKARRETRGKDFWAGVPRVRFARPTLGRYLMISEQDAELNMGPP
jgi:hypothetical protein